MKKRLLIIIGIVAIAAIAFFALRPATQSVSAGDKPVVKIGVIMPLAGNLSPFGQAAKTAIMAAAAKANANPANKFYYKLIIENDNADMRGANKLAMKQATVDKVDAFISLFPYAGLGIKPIALEYHIPHIASNYTPNVPDGEYNWSNFIMVKNLVQPSVDFVKSRNAKKVYVAIMNYESAVRLLDGLNAAAKANGIKIQSDVFSPDEKDFKLIVNKIKNSDADLIIVNTMEPALDMFAREMRAQGIDMPVIAAGDSFFLSGQPALFEGWYNLGSAPVPHDFAQKIGLSEKLNPAWSNYLYDSFNTFVSVFEKTGTTDGPTIAETIRNMKSYTGIVGTYEVLPTGNLYAGINLSVMKDGQWQVAIPDPRH